LVEPVSLPWLYHTPVRGNFLSNSVACITDKIAQHKATYSMVDSNLLSRSQQI